MTKAAEKKSGSRMISVRLPNQIADRVESIAKSTNSQKTDVIRRALSVYFRLGSAMMVPISNVSRIKLKGIAEARHRSLEEVAEDLLLSAIDHQCKGEPTQFVLRTRSTMEFDGGSAVGRTKSEVGEYYAY